MAPESHEPEGEATPAVTKIVDSKEVTPDVDEAAVELQPEPAEGEVQTDNGLDSSNAVAVVDEADRERAEAELEAAREVLGQILASAQVENVVCVDDEYAMGPTSTDAADMLLTLPSEDRAKVGGLRVLLASKANLAEMPNEVLRELFESRWEGAKDRLRNNVYQNLLMQSGLEHQLDESVAHVLRKLFNGRRLIEKSLTQWRAERNNILENNPPEKTLYLIDQDFSDEDGGSDQGIQLIKELQELFPDSPLFCGLLSHTFSPHEEHTSHESFSRAMKLDPSNFMLISKQRVISKIRSFVLMIKLSILNPLRSQLNTEVERVLDGSLNEAKQALRSMTIYEYEKIVFESSRREGVWEPDTMFRLFGIFQRREARRAAKNDHQLEEIAGRIRSISGSSSHKLGTEPRHPFLIQRLEMYEEAEHLNSYHLPTELGDIYQMNSGQLFLLLAQPCELMVRTNDGSRKETMNEGFVVEVVPDRPQGPLGEPGYFELPFFREDGSTWFVNYRRWRSVQLWVMDLCVFHPEGKAEFSVESECPHLVIPSWKRYHNRLCDHVRRVGEQHFASDNDVFHPSHGIRFPSVRPELPPLFPGRYDADSKTLRVDCQRVGRLHMARATAALSGFFTYQSRAAYEHDFEERGESSE